MKSVRTIYFSQENQMWCVESFNDEGQFPGGNKSWCETEKEARHTFDLLVGKGYEIEETADADATHPDKNLDDAPITIGDIVEVAGNWPSQKAVVVSESVRNHKREYTVRFIGVDPEACGFVASLDGTYTATFYGRFLTACARIKSATVQRGGVSVLVEAGSRRFFQWARTYEGAIERLSLRLG